MAQEDLHDTAQPERPKQAGGRQAEKIPAFTVEDWGPAPDEEPSASGRPAPNEEPSAPATPAPNQEPSASGGSASFAKGDDAAKAKGARSAKTSETDRSSVAPPSFGTRLRSGAIYIVVSVACLLINSWTCALYLAAVSAICAFEFYDMMHKDGRTTNDIAGIVAAAFYPIVMLQWGLDGVGALTVLFMMLLIIWFVYFMRARVPDVSVSFFGAGYTGMMLSSLVLLRQTLPEPWGGVLLLIFFASVWFNDVGAYLVGSKIGRHKLAPKTSPKKSWEGFIAGLIVSALFWCLMTLVPGVQMSLLQAIIFGIVCGAAGVVGDLAESRIKRNVGVKDSGTLMPGHGGLLDRSDSLFFSSVVAVILLFMGGCVPYA